MKEWLTAKEIASAKLPELPTSERAVQLMAAREGWNENANLARPRSGRGGGTEYHVTSLPALAQIAYFQRNSGVVAEPAAECVADNQNSEQLTARGQRERDARLAIIAAFERFSRGLRLGKTSKLQIFCDKYTVGSIQVDPWIKDLVPAVSKRSLARWLSMKRHGRIADLAVDRGASRKGTGALDIANDGAVKTHMLALLTRNLHYSADHIRTLTIAEFGPTVTIRGKSVPMPPLRTFQHALKGLKERHKVELTKLTNPDAYRSHYAPAGSGALRHVANPNDLWQIDASPIDALCVDGRHTVYSCIDIATRRTIWQVSRTPRASAVALLIRKAILKWGVPHTIKVDNGSDFIANDTKRLFYALGIEMELSDAYSPQQKGHVERVIKTFQHTFVRPLQGFVGHNVIQRKQIENRKSFAARLGESDEALFDAALTGDDVQALADRWARVYEHKAHAGLKGKSPFQVAMAAASSIRTVDERALDILLMPVAGKDGQRRTTKQGIKIRGFHYATPTILPQVDVFVRENPEDIGIVYAFDAESGRYLGEGNCPELSGISHVEFHKRVKAGHQQLIDDMVEPVRKQARKIAKGPAQIEEYLRVKEAEIETNVIPLPKRTIEHSTPEIAAALDAMDTIAGTLAADPTDPAVLAEQRRLVAEMDEGDIREAHDAVEEMVNESVAQFEVERRATVPADSNVTRLPESPRERYRRAFLILRDIKAGEPVDPIDAIWAERYSQGHEFKGEQGMHEEYGDRYLGL